MWRTSRRNSEENTVGTPEGTTEIKSEEFSKWNQEDIDGGTPVRNHGSTDQETILTGNVSEIFEEKSRNFTKKLVQQILF